MTQSNDNLTQSKTRVLFVCHDGRMYGSQKSLELLVQHLPKDQFEVMVSFARGGPLMESLAQVPGVQVVCHQRLAWAKHTLRSPLKRLGDVVSLGLNLPRVASLLAHVRRFRPHVIHSNSLASLEGMVVAKLTHTPHVWHCREIFTAENPRFNLTLGETLGRKLILAGSQRVICISKYVAGQFTGAQNLVVIPNAIALEPGNPSYPPVEVTLHLAYAGRVSEGKRFGDMIEALALLKARWQGPWPYRLHVFGEFIDPAFESATHARIDQTQLRESVVFEGYVSPLSKGLGQCHVLVMPTENEAFGRVLLDAFALGLPVVVPRGGAAPEIVAPGKTGFFYPPHDVVGLSKVIESLWDGREKLSEMSPQCLEAVSTRYNIHTQVTAICALYTTLQKETTPCP